MGGWIRWLRWDRYVGWLCFALAAFSPAPAQPEESSKAESSSYCPASFQAGNPPQLALFPLDGPKIAVPLPPNIPGHIRAITFSPNGRAIYGQPNEPLNRSNGIYMIEFHPVRERLIPGSIGVGEVQCLSAVPESQTIILSGWSWVLGKGGVFEIDPESSTSRELPADSPSVCGGPGGLTSPDGKRVLSRYGKRLGIRDLNTGKVETISGVSADATCKWAPNGILAVCVSNQRLALIDATGVSRPRNLGTSGNGPVAWSPDSKHILLTKSQLSCALTLYGDSLEVLNIETRKRMLVRSSHCSMLPGSIGWLDYGVSRGGN
jgi:hypothetical protein